MTVSTSNALLSALKLEDVLYGSVLGGQDEEQETGRSWWNIPGMGAVGIGAVTAALVGAYIAAPKAKELLDDTLEVFGLGEKKGEEGVEKAEAIGKKGAEYKGEEAKDGKPPIAETKLIETTVPKAEATVPDPVAPPEIPVEQPRVNRMENLPEVNTSGAPFDPNAKLARPTIEIRNVLQNTAKTEGVDYGTLYAFAGAESSFRSGATAKNSSATGLFQFTAPTWNYLVKTVYPELGYEPQDRLDPQKSAVVAARYIKTIKISLAKSLGKAPTLGQTYLGYFMGPTGAANFISAMSQNPEAKGADVFPTAAKANPRLFYDKGNTNHPLTLRQTMDQLEGKVVKYYQDSATVQPIAETAPKVSPVSTSMPVAPIKTIPSKATPQVQTVPVPNFDAVAPKNEERVPQTSQVVDHKSKELMTNTVLVGGGDTRPSGDVQYFRDKHGRIISTRG
jgi:hypothetical protein